MGKIEVRWGAIYFLCSVLWIYFEKSMGWHGPEIDKHAAYSIIFAIPAIFIYWLALRNKRKKSFQGEMTWKLGFLSGMRMTFVIILLSPIAQILFHRYFSPDYFSNMIEFAVNIENRDRERMEHFFTLSNFIFQAMKDALIWGAVMSAMIPAVMKKQIN
jgi:membrane protease YdiL (CAAX protease family)